MTWILENNRWNDLLIENLLCYLSVLDQRDVEAQEDARVFINVH